MTAIPPETIRQIEMLNHKIRFESDMAIRRAARARVFEMTAKFGSLRYRCLGNSSGRTVVSWLISRDKFGWV